jgi:transposase
MAEYDADPDVMLGDKGYDSDAIRDEVRARGGRPEIPTKKNRRIQHTIDRALYATRNRIERFFNRLKNSRRVATRYDHTASSFMGFVKLATIKQWIGFVHAT